MTGFIARATLAALLASAFAYDADAAPLAYVASGDGGTLSVIETGTNRVVKTLFGMPFPTHVTLNQSGTRAYITALNSSPPVIFIFNTLTNTTINTVSVPAFAGTYFTNIVTNPVQPYIYLGYVPDQIFVLDAASSAPTTPITVPVSGGDTIGNIAVDPSGTTIYATKTPSGDISVINAASGVEITTIPGGGFADVAVDPTGAFVYAVGETFPFARDLIIVSDTVTNTVVDSQDFPGCTFLRGLTFDASGATLYAACGATNEVAVIDTATLTAIEVPVGFVPTGTSLTPDGALLYVTNQADDSVSVMDTATNTVVDTIPVPDGPISIGDFIGPSFVCGNNLKEPGEGCDDGNVADGDTCSSNCYAAHESVIAAVKPVKMTIPSGNMVWTQEFKIKVRNADVTPHSIQVVSTDDCSGAIAYSKFGNGQFTLPVAVEPGKTASGVAYVVVNANSMFQLNHQGVVRCNFTLTASAAGEYTTDPTLSNNVAVLQVDITDENQADMTTVHETTILPAKPVKLKIKDGALSGTRKVKFKVGNADYLPTPEAAASHSVSVTALDGDCPAMTVGTPSFGGDLTADVAGGDTATGTVSVTIAAADVTTPSKLLPARCAVTLTAVGPPGDSVSSNNTTSVVLEITDLNDF
jgi:YVTN family beta-propeller protein/cysteine-rich repeat protein